MKRKPPELDKPYRKHRPVSEDEIALWRAAIEGEIPKPVKPEPREYSVLSSEKPKKKTNKRSGETPLVGVIDKATASKIRRGSMAINATLDLHGYTRDTAFEALVHFIMRVQARGLTTVLIITGKGSGGKEGTLKTLLPHWLAESPLREHIIAYDSAGLRHGGSGAWYVRIRKKKAHD